MAQAKTKSGKVLDLELYKFDSCPYCQKVMRVVDALKVPVTMRDIMDDGAAAKKLVEVGGDDQVPCLFVDGKPMYESDDINAFLKENFGK
ncbi:MAG TPA: glutaredoxin domain-containing protein [Planctomycetota bacterium]|nr:glutaredoxin domain-containing protein [Planctomycetota bacterium]